VAFVTTTLDPAQVAQHGAHEAAAALSRLLRLPVVAGAFAALDPASLAAVHGGIVVVITFDTSGIDGTLAVVLDDEVAQRLASRLTGGGADTGTIGPTALAALAELGNIAASAFLNAVARQVKRSCLPSVPRVGHAAASTALAATLPDVVMPVATLSAEDVRFSLAFVPRVA
jgi:chemotaxis protein CheY-P-specific phosphatase CheC